MTALLFFSGLLLIFFAACWPWRRRLDAFGWPTEFATPMPWVFMLAGIVCLLVCLGGIVL